MAARDVAGESTARPPWTLVGAGVLAAVEGVAALVFGVLEIFQIRAARAIVGIGVAAFMIGFAVLLVAAARGLWHERRWARAPVVMVQIVLLPVGWSFRDAPTTWVAVSMIVVAVATLVLVLHPRSTQALLPADEGESEPG